MPRVREAAAGQAYCAPRIDRPKRVTSNLTSRCRAGVSDGGRPAGPRAAPVLFALQVSLQLVAVGEP
eukprot:6458400-Lingulodinium_polyedra.AAC.1